METLRKSVHPKAHVTMRKNAMFRTFASLYSKGTYHVFYECFPFGTKADKHYCGHSSSEDLLTWKNESIAIFPSRKEDADGAFAGCAHETEDGEIEIFYVGAEFSDHPNNDLNSIKPGASIKTSLMVVVSHHAFGHLEFDNVEDKRVVFEDEDLVKAGFKSGSMKDPEYYLDNGDTYLTFLALTAKDEPALVILKAKGEGFSYFNRILLDKDYSWTELRFFDCGEDKLCVFERTKNRKDIEVRIGFGSLDLKKAKIKADFKSFQPLDYGADLYSPKIGYDTRSLPYVIASYDMKHEIKGSIGMLSLPKRIAVENGRIITFLHPLLTKRLTYPDKETLKIKQTHFPVLAKFKLQDEGYISFGNLGLFFNNNTLNIDRRKAFNAISNLPLSNVGVCQLPIKGQECEVLAVLDQDTIEIDCNGYSVSFLTCDAESKIKSQKVIDLELLTVNQTKG